MSFTVRIFQYYITSSSFFIQKEVRHAPNLFRVYSSMAVIPGTGPMACIHIATMLVASAIRTELTALTAGVAHHARWTDKCGGNRILCENVFLSVVGNEFGLGGGFLLHRAVLLFSAMPFICFLFGNLIFQCIDPSLSSSSIVVSQPSQGNADHWSFICCVYVHILTR